MASIFHFSKNYGSLTLETKFKVEINKGDLPCLFSLYPILLVRMEIADDSDKKCPKYFSQGGGASVIIFCFQKQHVTVKQSQFIQVLVRFISVNIVDTTTYYIHKFIDSYYNKYIFYTYQLKKRE